MDRVAKPDAERLRDGRGECKCVCIARRRRDERLESLTVRSGQGIRQVRSDLWPLFRDETGRTVRLGLTSAWTYNNVTW